MSSRFSIFGAPRLTRGRIILALTIAVFADFLQVMLLPIAMTFAQSGVDVVAMIFIVLLLGFHPLLLPTFLIEFIPVADVLPTWTGCVMAVIALRKIGERKEPAPPPVIDVESSSKRID